MMNCDAYRRSMLADPRGTDPALREHLGTCRECAQFSERLLAFESRLDRVLRLDWPSEPAVRPFPAQARRFMARRGMLAMAASVLMAVVVAGVLWVTTSGSSLAAAVVNHMGGEPDAWRQTDVPVPDAELESVLRGSNVSLSGGAGLVSYAASCKFRGVHVPHLVLQTASGPITVMVLVHENVPKPVRFDEEGYRGVIVPVAGHGSLAVLTHDAAADMKTVELIAAQVLDSITWIS